MSLRGALGDLFGNPIPALQVHGWIVAGVLAASVIWMVLPAVTRYRGDATRV